MCIESLAEVNTRTAAASSRRTFARLPNGLVRLDQDTRCGGTGTGLDVTGPHWVFAIVSVTRGRLSYLHGRADVRPPGRRFAVFFPPYSVVQCRLDHVHSRSSAIAGRGPVPSDVPVRPVAFSFGRGGLPASGDEVFHLIRRRRRLVPIGREHEPLPLSWRVKALIDEQFGDLPRLSSVAAQFHTSPAVISRCFSRDYGMPPVRYRHAIRVMDAMMRLMAGEPVMDVAGAVGFRDLGQFYRQFGMLALAPPGRYRLRSRNPKTP